MKIDIIEQNIYTKRLKSRATLTHYASTIDTEACRYHGLMPDYTSFAAKVQYMRSSGNSFSSRIRQFAVSVVRNCVAIPHRGAGRICPICDASAKSFLPFGSPPRPEAQCWRCHSLERHRFLWYFLTHRDGLALEKTQNFLHVAPEPALREKFQEWTGGNYLTADLFANNVDLKMDITNIEFPEAHFDAIYCSHVLEHVSDDRQAIRELYRVLQPGGWAILLVPITAQKTFEDATINTPQARLEVFGQEDHVRNYGPDYIDRLREPGFTVEKLAPSDLLDTRHIATYGLGKEAGDIFLCYKH